MFELTLDNSDKKGQMLKVIRRAAVRAVIMKDNKLLMVYSGPGDYKFPGGGVKNGEVNEEALVREVLEETGYSIVKIKEKLGMVKTINNDQYEEGSIFEMESHYYLCQIEDKQGLQQLDEYEAELGFQPVWISIEDAIRNNEEIMLKDSCNSWVGRETKVLHLLNAHL